MIIRETVSIIVQYKDKENLQGKKNLSISYKESIYVHLIDDMLTD